MPQVLDRGTGSGPRLDSDSVDRIAEPRSEAQAVDRFPEIDVLRGIAIVMMVLFHLVWDLDNLGDADIDTIGGFWGTFATATASLFLLLVGVSLAVSNDRARRAGVPRSTRVRRLLLRGLRILGYGLLITLVVALANMDGNIWFGILHLIGVAILLAIPFLGRPRLALVAAVMVFAATPVVRGLPVDSPWLLWLGARGDIGRMFDYRPLAPWLGVVLLGVAGGTWLYRHGRRRVPWPDGTPPAPVRLLASLGRRSLAIYLLHQPVLIGLLFAAGLIELS